MLTTLSCKKEKVRKLQGTWKLIEFNQSTPSSTADGFWRFKDDMVIRIAQDTTPTDTANYTIEVNITKSYLIFSDFQFDHLALNGKWLIQKLNEDVLILITEEAGGQTAREFYKIEDMVLDEDL